MKNFIISSLTESARQLALLIHEEEQLTRVEEIAGTIISVFKQGSKILICGNGGSSTDAMHFAEEFTGRFRQDRKPLPVIALTDPSHITCVGNDYGFTQVFSRAVEAYGQPGDLLIAVSTSGNSENILNAVASAQNQGMGTVTLLGKDGGKLRGKADLEIIIPAETTDRIQEMHGTLLHIFIELTERVLFPENYPVTE